MKGGDQVLLKRYRNRQRAGTDLRLWLADPWCEQGLAPGGR